VQVNGASGVKVRTGAGTDSVEVAGDSGNACDATVDFNNGSSNSLSVTGATATLTAVQSDHPTIGTMTIATSSVGSVVGEVILSPGDTHATHQLYTVGTLTLTSGGGLLDLGHQDLLLKSTSASTVRADLVAAYTSSQDWHGDTGINSLDYAKNDSGTYSNGWANSSDTSTEDAQIALSDGTTFGHDTGETTGILVRAVLVGDVNMDKVVDFFDISQATGYGYNTTDGKYTDGDIDYSGHIDSFDLALITSGNYNAGVPF
jgi:hypothetical protein